MCDRRVAVSELAVMALRNNKLPEFIHSISSPVLSCHTEDGGMSSVATRPRQQSPPLGWLVTAACFKLRDTLGDILEDAEDAHRELCLQGWFLSSPVETILMIFKDGASTKYTGDALEVARTQTIRSLSESSRIVKILCYF